MNPQRLSDQISNKQLSVRCNFTKNVSDSTVYTTSELHTGIQDFRCVQNQILPHVCIDQLSLCSCHWYDTFNLIKLCGYRLLYTL